MWEGLFMSPRSVVSFPPGFPFLLHISKICIKGSEGEALLTREREKKTLLSLEGCFSEKKKNQKNQNSSFLVFGTSVCRGQRHRGQKGDIWQPFKLAVRL